MIIFKRKPSQKKLPELKIFKKEANKSVSKVKKTTKSKETKEKNPIAEKEIKKCTRRSERINLKAR